MKFLCDRCKTRYSIGDERVRGKILKIRCKNCSNVITVREGMAPDPEAPAEPAARTKKATTAAPATVEERSAPTTAAATPRAPAAGDAGRAARAEPAAAASRAGAGREPMAASRSGAREPAVAKSPDAAAQPRPGGKAGAAQARPSGQAGAAQARPSGQAGAAQARRSGSSDASGSRGTPGSGARAAVEPRGDSVNALNAAFASAMASPPPAALEEEWYVSIDGEQAGPYSLADAQHWVSQQPFEAELHCWSEGFDDWLSVDKVSHFRGLRKRPAAPAPPPVPRAGGAPPRAAATPPPAPVDDEPRPLFAATMASLERGAPAVSGLGLPPPAAPVRATPPQGSVIQPRSRNGAQGAKPETRDARDAESAARPLIGDPFDVSETGDAATQLEAMPFEDAPAEPRRAQPAAGAVGRAPGRIPLPAPSDTGSIRVIEPHRPSPTLRGTGPSAAAFPTSDESFSDFGSDDLDIGEVSRVVNLADVARTARPPDRGGARRTGSIAAVRPPGLAANLGAGAAGSDGDPAMTIAPVARAHRRGLITLLAVAAVVVLAVVGAVIVFVTNEADTTDGDLGAVRDIDTSRPDDPVAHHPAIGSASPAPVPPPPPPRAVPHTRTGVAAGSQLAEAPAGNALASDEIEEVARKHQEATQRCYMRSQRGADAILVGEVKKISVTLTVDRDGNVSNLELSDHAADVLGRCLSGAIRGWKFRQSAGGTFRFSLAFASG